MWDAHVKHKYLLKYLIVLVLGSSRRCLRSSWLCLCLYRFFSINFVIFSEQKFFGTSREDYCEKMYGLCSKILFARGFVQKKNGQYTWYISFLAQACRTEKEKGQITLKAVARRCSLKKMFSKKNLLTLFFTEHPWATISVTLGFKAVTQNFWKIILKF